MLIGVSIGLQAIGNFSETYKGYNIKHVQIGNLPPDVDTVRSDLHDIADRFKTSNPDTAISLHAYPFNLAEKVEAIQNIWIELSERTISLASEIGALFVNFHLGYGIDAGKRNQHDASIKWLIPVLSRLAKIGEDKNVEVHIENLYPEQRNSDFCKLGDRVSDFKKVFDCIDTPWLKLCYDYGHGNLDEHGIDILRSFTNRLGSIHAHDNDQLSDIHWAIGNKNIGTIDWDSEIQFLEGIDFKGTFILESYINDQLESLTYLRKLGVV